MSQLRVYAAGRPSQVVLETREGAEMSSVLAGVGIRFERWAAAAQLAADANDQDVMRVYAADIERLSRENGYQSVDVIRVLPDNPKKEELRAKFLSEHIHDDDEVRFFVEGAGLFYLHVGESVYVVLCESGDLISVPAGVPHWFDMGEMPFITAIRLFTSPDGWVAKYTGDAIADGFPKFEERRVV